MLEALTLTTKISVLKQVVKIVEKSGIAFLDAFISIMGEIEPYKGYNLRENTWVILIKRQFPEIKNKDSVIKNPNCRDRWQESAWLKSKKGKRQRVEFLKQIREIYIQNYLEETKKQTKKKQAVNV
jgi:GTPase involved in cell partitioning and DNA repair